MSTNQKSGNDIGLKAVTQKSTRKLKTRMDRPREAVQPEEHPIFGPLSDAEKFLLSVQPRR